MIRLESKDNLAVLFDGYHEFAAASQAVADTDPPLADTLKALSDMVRYEGLNPHSTYLAGRAATSVVAQMERLSGQHDAGSALARILLEDAVVVPYPEQSIVFQWPEGDVVEHIQSLAEGPHSAEIDMDASMRFDSEAEFFNDLRRVPSVIE